MRSIHNIKFLFILLVVASVTFVSCSKDEPEVMTDIIGCMDENAENYNPNANIGDNSCVYSRDKFFGNYIGSITFTTFSNLNQMDIPFALTPGINTDSEVLMSVTLADIPVFLSGEAMGNDVLINSEVTIPNGGVINELFADQEIIVKFDGTISTSDEAANIGGPLLITVSFPDTPGTPPFPDNALLEGVKQ